MSGASTDVAYLTRALKIPRAREVAPFLADTARKEAWDYLEFRPGCCPRRSPPGRHTVGRTGSKRPASRRPRPSTTSTSLTSARCPGEREGNGSATETSSHSGPRLGRERLRTNAK